MAAVKRDTGTKRDMSPAVPPPDHGLGKRDKRDNNSIGVVPCPVPATGPDFRWFRDNLSFHRPPLSAESITPALLAITTEAITLRIRGSIQKVRRRDGLAAPA
jgi:hypothetical protein